MKTALIFPGQGSQYAGMGFDFYQKYSASKEIFDELDEILKKNLKSLIFSSKNEELSKTQNAQPAIMTTSIAILSALRHEKLISENSFSCVAGHSLGEYSALVANSSIKFTDAVKLLKVRSKAMQDSMPIGTGGMVAIIGCGHKEVEILVSEVSQIGKIYVANDNANGQIVLSGQTSAIEYVLENSKQLNIKRAIKIPVSAPFHCKLMNSASNIMSLEIDKYTFKPFDVPLYSNVTAKICSHVEISQLLVDQIISKVKWRETIENMISAGVQNFIEVGPSNVLTNLVKRTSKDVKAISISKLEDLDNLDMMAL